MANKSKQVVTDDELCEFAKDFVLDYYARAGNVVFGVEIDGEYIASTSLPSSDYNGSYHWFTIHESKVLRTFLFKRDDVDEEYIVRVDAQLVTSDGYFNCHTNTESEDEPVSVIKNYRIFIECNSDNDLFVDEVEEHKEDEEEWEKFCAQSSTSIPS